MIKIRAWDYHAFLRLQGAVADFDFESLEAPYALSQQVPRIALIPHTYTQYVESVQRGVRGCFPRRDSRARSERDPRLRPRARATIASPVTMNRVWAYLSGKAQGYKLQGAPNLGNSRDRLGLSESRKSDACLSSRTRATLFFRVGLGFSSRLCFVSCDSFVPNQTRLSYSVLVLAGARAFFDVQALQGIHGVTDGRSSWRRPRRQRCCGSALVGP